MASSGPQDGRGSAEAPSDTTPCTEGQKLAPTWLAQSHFVWALPPRDLCIDWPPPRSHADSVAAAGAAPPRGTSRPLAWWPLPREAEWSLRLLRAGAPQGAAVSAGAMEPAAVLSGQLPWVDASSGRPLSLATNTADEGGAKASKGATARTGPTEPVAVPFWQMASVGTWLGQPAAAAMSTAEESGADVSDGVATPAVGPELAAAPFWQMPSVGTWLSFGSVARFETSDGQAAGLSGASQVAPATEMGALDVAPPVTASACSQGRLSTLSSRQGRLSTLSSKCRTPSASTAGWNSCESETEGEPVMSPHPLDWPLSREEKKMRVCQITDWERMAVIRQNRRLKRRLSEGPPRSVRHVAAEPPRRSLPRVLLKATP